MVIRLTPLICALAICAGEVSDAAEKDKNADGVTASIELFKPGYDMLHPVLVKIRVTNGGDIPCSVRRHPVVSADFKVQRDDELVGTTRYFEMASVARQRGSVVFEKIMPGESYSQTYRLDQLFDMSVGGKYEVSASVPFDAGGEGVAIAKAVTVERFDDGTSLDQIWDSLLKAAEVGKKVDANEPASSKAAKGAKPQKKQKPSNR